MTSQKLEVVEIAKLLAELFSEGEMLIADDSSVHACDPEEIVTMLSSKELFFSDSIVILRSKVGNLSSFLQAMETVCHCTREDMRDSDQSESSIRWLS